MTDKRLAEVSSPATPRQAKLQRYERDVVNHQGGHYGEEQWTTVEMVPCETGAWVKYRDIEWAASPATPQFTENEIKDVLCALYQDGHVDLVLADRIAALMRRSYE